MPRLYLLAAAFVFLLAGFPPAAAAPLAVQGLGGVPASECMAIASAPPPLRLAATGPALTPQQVRISYVGHSTFLIESADGVTIATDYNGYSGGVLPRVVTMNHAHTSHYTAFPDPEIEHVLRGWDTGDGPAKHRLQLDDVLIRNVTTDIRAGYESMERDGNSIFIFEVAGLCIGHLGHLHHRLSDGQYAMIGRIDVLMVPVDGTYTMGHDGMLEVIKRLRASIVLPMHYFGSLSLNGFLTELGKELDVELSPTASVVLSRADLPRRPKLLVLPGY